MGTAYDSSFFETRKPGASRSAEVLVPIVMDLLRPRSVVDVGCGFGTWLAVFQQEGVQKILGIDGDYVAREKLEIPEDCFRTADLSMPLEIAEKFDLVVSLEVAEHLPRERAEQFVGGLVGLGPAVLFSAAVPFQGGTAHVNEQWPQYWARLFAKHNFVAVDCLREQVWDKQGIDWWYAQNAVLYVSREVLDKHPELIRDPRLPNGEVLPLVHPKNYLRWARRGEDKQEFTKRLCSLSHDLAQTIPSKVPFVLIDDEQCREFLKDRFCCRPFLERHGEYWGAPANDAQALAELQRMRAEGAKFLVLAWPSFWWLEQYRNFGQELRNRFQCVLENREIMIFDLEAPPRRQEDR